MTSSTWIKSIGFFLWLLAWPAMMNHQAAAQSGGIDLADIPPVPALPQVTPNHLLADQLVILAQQLAHGSTQPTSAQMQAMQMMLDQALILEQGDPELWRMQIELTRRSNNPEKHMTALQSYLALVPGDDAAQMDLILLHLQKPRRWKPGSADSIACSMHRRPSHSPRPCVPGLHHLPPPQRRNSATRLRFNPGCDRRHSLILPTSRPWR